MSSYDENRIFLKDEVFKNKRLELITELDGNNKYYISDNGEIYSDMMDGYFYKKKLYKNKKLGYIYTNMREKNFRVHKLVANHFCHNPNPEKFNCISHEDNDKTNNNYKNLKWCDTSYNTQKAYDEGLAKNDKSYDDSQSHPVLMLDSKTDDIVEMFGSMKEASRYTGYSVSTISRQAFGKVKTHPRKPFYFILDLPKK